MTAIPETQKAWRAHRRGRPRDILSLDEIPVPKPGPNQALVKVHAAALNPVGYKMMILQPSIMAHRPKVAEYDFTGTVVSVGSDAAFHPGDKVWGMLDLANPQGSLAQYILVSDVDAALVPDSLSQDQAAGLGCVGLTAHQAIFKWGQVEAGQSVLVLGGSTSVGSLAIQMLKQLGCQVTTSCSEKNIEFVKSLGADVVYDYTVSPISAQLLKSPPSPKFHAIIDCVGGYDVWRSCEAYLAPSGNFVAIGTAIRGLHSLPGELWEIITTVLRPTWLGGVNRKRITMLAEVKKGNQQPINDIINKGGVVPIVDSVYEFEDVLTAYDRLMSDRSRGKLVIHVP